MPSTKDTITNAQLRDEFPEGLPEGCVPFRLWCDKHKRPHVDGKTNVIAAANAMVSLYIGKMMKAAAPGAGRAEFEKLLTEAAKKGSPICCLLTEDELDQLFGDSIPTTGDEAEDRLAAVAAVPEMQPMDEGDCGDPDCPDHGRRKTQ